MTRIVCASDHAAADFVADIAAYLRAKGHDVDMLNTEMAFSYAEAADAVVQRVRADSEVLALLCCGTGIGACMRANRYKGVRAPLIHDAFTAEMAIKHSHANVICMGSRVVSVEQGKALMDIVLTTEFEGGRHIPRLEQLDAPTEEEK